MEEQPQSFPVIGRVTFTVHLIIAVLIGLALLIIPSTFGGWFGYPAVPDVEPPLRAFGAIILGFGGLTSLYGIRTKSWERVDYIVRGEITYLALQIIVFVVSTIIGSGSVVGNWIFTVVSAVLLGLFIATWVTRPK